MANLITGIRVFCSMALVFFSPLSIRFYIIYAVGGFTDIIDGVVARKTATADEFGAKFDTVADFIFVAVCLVKLLPILDIPAWIFIWTAVIALIKVINFVFGYFVQKRFVALHTKMNKITGALLFLLPFTVSVADLRYSAALICTVATIAAMQEGHFIRTKRKIY